MIPHWLTNPQLGNGSVYCQILNQSWEILPVERNFKKPLWFTHCCLTRASLYPHITETKTRFSKGRNTQALRLQQFMSDVRSQCFATEQWQSAVNQVRSSQRWVEPNQGSVPKQCSNIRTFSGPSLSAHARLDRPRQDWTDHAIQTTPRLDRPRHPKPRVLARRNFYFRSTRIVIVTHRSANEKESAGRLGSPGLPDLRFWRQIAQIWLF